MAKLENRSDSSLVPVISKLINVIILLLVLIAALIVVIIIYVPGSKPKVENKKETPVPDANGNFTEAGKHRA